MVFGVCLVGNNSTILGQKRGKEVAEKSSRCGRLLNKAVGAVPSSSNLYISSSRAGRAALSAVHGARPGLCHA